MKTFKHSAALAALAAAGTGCMVGLPIAHAGLLAYEPFNYATGSSEATGGDPNTLNGLAAGPGSVQSPGFGFTASGWYVYGGEPFSIQSGSLSASSNSGSLTTTGNSVTYNNPGGQIYSDLAYAQLANPITSAGTTTWYSFLLTPTNGWNGVMMGDIQSNWPNSGFQVGTNGTSFYVDKGMGTSNWGGPNLVTGGTASNSNTYFMVVQDIGATTSGGTDTINLFVDPTPGATAPTTSSPSYVLTNTQLATGSLNYVILGSQFAASWDELRIGTTYADVAPVTSVPEPGALGMLAAGGVALVLIGRKRRRTT